MPRGVQQAALHVAVWLVLHPAEIHRPTQSPAGGHPRPAHMQRLCNHLYPLKGVLFLQVDLREGPAGWGKLDQQSVHIACQEFLPGAPAGSGLRQISHPPGWKWLGWLSRPGMPLFARCHLAGSSHLIMAKLCHVKLVESSVKFALMVDGMTCVLYVQLCKALMQVLENTSEQGLMRINRQVSRDGLQNGRSQCRMVSRFKRPGPLENRTGLSSHR